MRKIEIFGVEYYAYLDDIIWYVKQNNGTSSDAEDLYQDALIVLLEKLNQDDFQLSATLKTYIFAICKNLWLKKLRHIKGIVKLEDIKQNDFFEEISDDIEKEKSEKEKIDAFFLKITDHCKELIEELFLKSATLDEIQKKYNYATKHNLSNQKYKCMQQIKRYREKNADK
ncbi:MAG: sigma-70 family RNA polymerase sigma factor [Chryseobacterium sp.]|nr:MAG: sigma-70 family RNA polymerase sigma factor [Chryseobacterium sp.]